MLTAATEVARTAAERTMAFMLTLKGKQTMDVDISERERVIVVCMYMLRLDAAGKIVDGVRKGDEVKKREKMNGRERKR